ncbi:MAG: ATP-binding cassette domain-containing protein [Streptosporangiales bacterium]|nr:ATP-binding cassette domain-containing protein [Streptosporangiales bacterium]
MTDLELVDVHKVFSAAGRDDVHAVAGLDLRVGGGELVGLLGPSGCGKSTTLRMIAGLEEVTSGDVRVGSKSMLGLPPQQRNIGVAFENYALYPPLTVRENIAFGLAARRMGDQAKRIDEVAERIGLADILDTKPAALSSGQKQRVALARAIAREPDVLLLDEPLSHLDAAQRDLTRRELRRLQQDLGYTTILVTHDQEEALSLADRVVVMAAGVAKQVDAPDAIYDDPEDLFVAQFVGEPAMNLFDAAMTEESTVVLGESVLPVRVASSGPHEVVVGVRPEDVSLVGQADAVAAATVVVYEDVLEYGLVTLDLPGVSTRLTAQTESGLALAAGDRVHVAFVVERTFVFERESGKRVR